MTRLLQRLGRESLYAIVGFPIAIAAFVVVVTGVSLGGGMIVTLVGFPILTLTAYAARGFAQAERAQLTGILERDAPTPYYERVRPGDSWLKRIFVPLGDPQSWLDMLFAFVGFITSTVSFVVVTTWWATGVGGLLYPLWGWALPDSDDSQDLPELLGLGDSYTLRVVFYIAAGAICLLTLPFVVRAMAAIKWAPAYALLSSRAREQEHLETRQRVEALEVGRDAARSAEANALRRLERDIHDGPQQRLVRLSMDLGRARKQAADAPVPLQETLDGALQQTRDTLDELRALSRGIAPPILADRGLTAALEELAARSAIPIRATIEVPAERIAPHAETTAYFVASEALTNVAKHSGATHADLSVTVDADRVRVRVVDDGHGGAHLSKGHGLLGLSDRVRAADGVLNIESPVGGPTTVVAEIPCGS
jgi:signal transduction histidine kinase